MIFHASLKQWGNLVDFISILLLLAFLVIYNAQRLLHFGRRSFVALGLAFVGGLGMVMAIWPNLMLPIFAAAAVGTGVFELYLRWRGRTFRRNGKTFSCALAALGIALGFWLASKVRSPLCRPLSLFQFHALWHLGAAVFVALMFLYLRTEVPLQPETAA
jgi:hypothetical protein